MYEGDDPSKDGIYMIHPEFLDEDGQAIGEELAVPLEGKASMWIMVPKCAYPFIGHGPRRGREDSLWRAQEGLATL